MTAVSEQNYSTAYGWSERRACIELITIFSADNAETWRPRLTALRRRDTAGNFGKPLQASDEKQLLVTRADFQSRSLFGPRRNCGRTLFYRPLILGAGNNGVAVNLALLQAA